MSVPPGHGAPPQWGSGIPGIPSIWDGPDAARGPEDDGRHPPVWRPPSHRSGSGPSAGRWALLVLVLTGVLVAGGGAGVLGTGSETAVVAPPDVLGAPAPPPGVPPPGFPELPAPAVVPAPPPGTAAGLVSATRDDGAGEPFGLPLGAGVTVRDGALVPALEVRPVEVSRDGADVFVDLQLRGSPQASHPVAVPRLLLRLPDGRELGWTHASSLDGFPSALAPGQVWEGTVAFPEPASEAVLVLDAGAPLAAWAVPAAG